MVELSAKLGRGAVWLLSLPIYIYRYIISPVLPPACRYQPSCSVYALEALRVHGPIKGAWLAARRLTRCHPVEWLGGSSGYDPVPAKHSHIEGRRA
ncbi:MAG: membrane protein insertion efficiency factor YidD [Alphaproteobacteria bacterium]